MSIIFIRFVNLATNLSKGFRIGMLNLGLDLLIFYMIRLNKFYFCYEKCLEKMIIRRIYNNKIKLMI